MYQSNNRSTLQLYSTFKSDMFIIYASLNFQTPRPRHFHLLCVRVEAECFEMSSKMGPGTLRGEWKDCRNDGLYAPYRERREEYRRMGQGLPGGPMVKALCFHHRGCRFDLWSGNKDSACQVVLPKKKKRMLHRKEEHVCHDSPQVHPKVRIGWFW